MNNWKELGINICQYSHALFSGRLACWGAGIAAVIGGYWSQAPELWKVLGVIAPGLFFLDLLTGIARSMFSEKQKFSSEVLSRSLVKAYVYLSLFLLCVALDWSVRTGYAAQLALLVFMTAREARSNLENLSALREVSGVDIPGFIGEGFEQFDKEHKYENRP